VYAAATEAEELQSVAAFYQSNCPKRADKLFGVCLTEDDCDVAGISIVADADGNTGVADVDRRHANLTGSQQQFSGLIARILGKLWEGENRLRVFPAWQILGELAVLSRLADNQIAGKARESCQKVVDNHADMLKYSGDGSCVELKKELCYSHLKPQVVAVRIF
jgi:hypothetical protein